MKLMEQQLHELGGLRVHIIPTDKYKTNTFVFRFKAPLNEETVTERPIAIRIAKCDRKITFCNSSSSIFRRIIRIFF